MMHLVLQTTPPYLYNLDFELTVYFDEPKSMVTSRPLLGPTRELMDPLVFAQSSILENDISRLFLSNKKRLVLRNQCSSPDEKSFVFFLGFSVSYFSRGIIEVSKNEEKLFSKDCFVHFMAINKFTTDVVSQTVKCINIIHCLLNHDLTVHPCY